MIIRMILAALVALSSTAAIAQDMYDFTQDKYQVIDGLNSADFQGDFYGDFTVSTSQGKTLTWNGFNGGLGDGIGVSDDEITGNDEQVITVEFKTAEFVTAVDFLDLFREGGDANPKAEGGYAEFFFEGGGSSKVEFNWDDNKGWAAAAGFTGDRGPNNTGDATLFVNFAQEVKSIEFTAFNDPVSDYSIARIRTGNDAPISTNAAALGLVGFLAMALRRRK